MVKQTIGVTEAKRLEKMYFSPIRQVGERAAELAKAGNDVIKFNVGEPDFNTPEAIKLATIEAIKNNKTHYASNRGVIELRKAVAKKLMKISGVDYDPETEILITSSGAEAINNSFLAFINSGDEVIVFTPAFMNYENLINMCGAKMVSIPLRKENGFQLDTKEIEKAITEKTKMIVINNPCNPTGIVYNESVLSKVAKLAIKHNILVFSDEMYNEIVYDNIKCKSIASFPKMKNLTITMNGFSKVYAMTGWRLGYVAAPSQIINSILKVHQYTTTCSPTFIQLGLAEVMNSREVALDVIKMRNTFNRRRKLVMEALDKIDELEYIAPEGAFYIFVNTKKTGLNGDEFASQLLEKYYVACVSGSKLGDWCKDYIRISYATSDSNLKQGMKLIKEFVQTTKR